MPNNPISANPVNFDIHDLINFSEEQLTILRKLLLEVCPMFTDERFREAVCNYSWVETYRKWFKKYSIPHNTYQGTNLTNEQVYEKLISGADSINPIQDRDIDISLTLYFKNNSVIGYTYPSTTMIWVNSKFFNYRLKTREGRAGVVANIVHEYMHKVGFDHSYKWTAVRQHSVPYAVGNIAEMHSLRFIS